jgi:hypothetical protein
MIVSVECLTCALSLFASGGLSREDCENFWRPHHTHAMVTVRVADAEEVVDDIVLEEHESDHVPGTCAGCGQKSEGDACRICGRRRDQEPVYVGKVRIR